MAVIPGVIDGQPYAAVEYPGDGATRIFSVPFPYLDEDHVRVYIDDDLATFEFLSAGSIQTALTPAQDAIVTVRRDTPPEEMLVLFQSQATLKATELNLTADQLLFLIQELTDWLGAITERVIQIEDQLEACNCND